MYKLDGRNMKKILRRLFSPITVMFVPHSSRKPLVIKLPSLGIAICLIGWIAASVYVVSMSVNSSRYQAMKETLSVYTQQINELQSSIKKIKEAEREFAKLLSTGSKQDIFNKMDAEQGSGSFNLDEVRQQIKEGIEKAGEIRAFLQEQRNVYLATPQGWPITGRITSDFGRREDPHHGGMETHSGIDISTPSGTGIYATADGIVSFSGWGQGNGNLIAIEHGMGYTTLYAHNSRNLVSEGQRVKRGDKIALSGSTGKSTGPHLHYEVWVHGKPVNPFKYLTGGDYVSKKK